ncbi:MAG: lipid-A-disaccharide synthase N-terminal domain-containing protein [Thermoanaerobaculales bacterium]|nr:lipid-A-disaccharide synthase N-terminal domain-containing protein [Thermoanaerobaculales bacterium]
MSSPGRRLARLVVAILVVVPAPALADRPPAEPPSRVELRVKPLPAGVKELYVEAEGDGGHRVVLVATDGSEERLTPAEFVARVERDVRGRGFLFSLLNITGPAGIAWVTLGLLGQAIFAGRMVVQWMVSERQRRSVVPVAFWWMSLVGASMMLVYFVWRRDIVGVLGQASGWVIYLRNLWLIRREA